MSELVKVKDLKSYFFLDNAVIRAADGVDLVVHRGEILGIVGSIGAGKSEVARAIFGADPKQSGTISISGKEVKIKA